MQESAMGRRRFLTKAGGALLAGTTLPLLASSSVKANPKLKWRLTLAVNRTLPIWATGLQRFAEIVRELSRGEFDIRVFGADELIPGLGVFDAVKKGEVEMGHAASYYWVGKMAASPFFSTVPFGMSASGQKAWIEHGGGQKLWDELYNAEGVQGFICGSTGVQMGGWFRKEIKSVADLKGLKMRIPGVGGQVLAAVGGQPMLVPSGEIFTNLSTGVIDAAEWVGPYHDYLLGFHKAVKNYYYPGWQEPGAVLELIINKKAWESLSKEQRNIVRFAAKVVDHEMSVEWPAKDAEYLARIQKEGKVSLRKFPEPVLAALKTASLTVKTEMAKTSPLAGKIRDSYDKFQKTFSVYERHTSFALAEITST